QHACGIGSMRTNQLDRLAFGAARRNYIIDNENPSAQWCAYDYSAFTVVLGFLAVAAIRQIVTLFGQSYRHGRRQDDALIGGPEQLVTGYARLEQRIRVEHPETPEAIPIVEKSCVKEVRCLTARFGYELTKAKHTACHCKGE